MACTLFQSTNIGAASSLYRKSHNCKQRGGITNVRMLCDSSVQMRPSLSIVVGGGGLDKLHSKVGRGSRFVARSSSMFESFTDNGMEVIELASEEATRIGYNYVGTEQILLGLIAQRTGIAALVLKSMGISLKGARVEVEEILNGTSNRFIPVTTMRVLERTREEARQLGHNYIDSEHLLLGLLREDECVAVRVLENLGADPNNIRTQVIRMVNGEITEAEGDGGNNTNSKIDTPDHEAYFMKLLKEGRLGYLREKLKAELDPVVAWIEHMDGVTKTGVNWHIRVIMRAHEEGRRLGHNFMATEQILLALIGEGSGIAAEVLKSMGINLKDARVEVEKIIGRGNNRLVTVEVPISSQAKRVLILSLKEARKLGHKYIGYEHLLLGLLRDRKCVAVRVLKNLGADPNNMRTQVIQMLTK